jgi:pimeloyl-ACP methyl ester carboxylesterase
VLSGDRVDDVVSQFTFQVKEHLRNYNLVLLAHSLGGLVAMEYVLRCIENENDPRVVGLITYGTPANGSGVVAAAEALGLAFSQVPLLGPAWRYFFRSHHQLQELKRGSEIIERIRDRWVAHVLNGGFPSVSPKRRDWIPVRAVFATSDGVVSRESARSFYGGIDAPPITCGHVELVKPESRESDAYQYAASFLRECRNHLDRDVRTQICAASDAILAQRRKPWVSDYRYEVEVTDKPPQHFPKHDENLLASFHVKQCDYDALLVRDRIVIAFSVGKAGWTKANAESPEYHHEIRLDRFDDSEQLALSSLFERLLKPLVKRKRWDAVVSEAQISVAGSPLDLTTVTGDWDHIVAAFAIPNDVVNASADRKVRVTIAFHTVIPRCIRRFRMKFPELTIKSFSQLTVGFPISTIHATPIMVGDPGDSLKLPPCEAAGAGKTVTVECDSVVMAGSSIEFSW